MGIYDREYWRYGPPDTSRRFGGAKVWSIATWIIVINIAIFLADAVLFSRVNKVIAVETSTGRLAMVDARIVNARGPDGSIVRLLQMPAGFDNVTPPMSPLESWGHFSKTMALHHGQVWRFVTFQFLHGGLMHLAGNMLGIYFFGQMIEQYLGRRRFLAFYLLCGATGPIAYMLLQQLGVLIRDPYTPLIGASAGVFGILIAAAQIAPRQTVLLLFPPIPLQLKTMAYILLGLAAFTVFTRGPNAGGEAAHLGGAALGFYLIRNPRLLDWAERLGPRQVRMRYRP